MAVADACLFILFLTTLDYLGEDLGKVTGGITESMVI